MNISSGKNSVCFSAYFKQLLRKWWLHLKTDRLLLLVTISTLLFITTDCFYVLLTRPLFAFFPSGDEPHYLVISQTILKYHSLDVMQDYRNGDYHLFYPFMLTPHVVRNLQGHLLPQHNIGGPILWLLPYVLLGRLGVVFFISMVAILILVNIYRLLCMMGSSERIAFMVTLSYALASPLYIYSHLAFVELLGAFICIYVLRKILQVEVTAVELWLCSFLLGLLPWIHIRFAWLEISLCCLLLYKLYRQHRLHPQDMAWLLPVAVLFAMLEVFSIVVWGTWNPAASQIANHTGPFEILPVKSIFLGLFFDQEYGLLFSSPIFLFLLIGITLSVRKPLLGYNLSMLIISLPYIILFASFRIWFGGANPPGRYLLVLLPLYCYYLAYALERLQNSLARAWFHVSIVYGLLYNLASISPPHNGFNAENGFNVTLHLLAYAHLPVTDYLPSLFACKRSLFPNCEQREVILFAVWIAFFSVLALLIVVQNNRKRSNSIPSKH
jgi:hypothetical protein